MNSMDIHALLARSLIFLMRRILRRILRGIAKSTKRQNPLDAFVLLRDQLTREHLSRVYIRAD